MSPLLKRCCLVVKKGITYVLVLLLFSVFSFFTPLFSSVGLWILYHLPVPKVVIPEIPNPMLFNSSVSNTTPLPLSTTASRPLVVNEPTAYVVLGGGLTEANTDQLFQNYVHKNTSDTQQNSTYTKQDTHTNTSLTANTIVLNAYSLSRMKTVVAHYQKRPLPIIVTGVEAPWMRDWLLNHGIDNVITENASMNTCENARFTAKRLKLTHVYLITDAYHMTRTRRQFALNGIQTLPIAAPLPMQKNWLSPKDNAQHSRRTLYELAAYTRDVVAPQQNCRQADDVSFATLLRSRKPEDIKTF